MVRTIAKDYDKKRGHILSVAAQVFATDGFDRASMSQLAAACGISKANIYHYYSGKDALLFDILDTYLASLRDHICNIDLTGLTPPQQLHAIVMETLIAYQGADHEHRVQTAGIGILPADKQEALRAYQRDMIAQMSNVLAAISPETFAEDRRKLRATTMSVFGMLNWFYMWNGQAGTKERQDYARLVSDLVLTGLDGI